MIAIKIENLWKEYRLGIIGHGTLAHDLQSWWAKLRGREDPNSKLSIFRGYEKQFDGDRFWALKGIDLEVKEGIVLGIIGKNGAGKSTLLKIISRVTAPTRGCIKVKGRIASLLQVGTGFHPEFTGRENIFLNGAILGMSKQETKDKLDEIIAFSGVENFIDTPVKRYSSGMYVRLAFAVAAHLEPEILIVDEVLAVGDAEFRNKCLGKMGELNQEGRTVLFVSHNMAAIESLCSSTIVINDGIIVFQDKPSISIDKYLSMDIKLSEIKLSDRKDREGSGELRYTKITLRNRKGNIINTVRQGDDLFIHISYKVVDKRANFEGCHFSIGMRDIHNRLIFNHQNLLIGKNFSNDLIINGSEITFCVKNIPFKSGIYTFNCDIVKGTYIDKIINVANINIIEGVVYNYKQPMQFGIVAIDSDWEIN